MTFNSMVKSTQTTPSQSASCHHCDWSSKDDQHAYGARKAAYEHTARTGHSTECQVVRMHTYEEDV